MHHESTRAGQRKTASGSPDTKMWDLVGPSCAMQRLVTLSGLPGGCPATFGNLFLRDVPPQVDLAPRHAARFAQLAELRKHAKHQLIPLRLHVAERGRDEHANDVIIGYVQGNPSNKLDRPQSDIGLPAKSSLTAPPLRPNRPVAANRVNKLNEQSLSLLQNATISYPAAAR